MKNTLLAVAPNGGRRTQADHPRLPITPAELAQTAVACAEAGATCFIARASLPHLPHSGGQYTDHEPQQSVQARLGALEAALNAFKW